MSVQIIRQADNDNPAVLQNRLCKDAPAQLYALGETAILRRRLPGLICSIQCHGSIVLKTFDAIRALRDAGMAAVGCFLSPEVNFTGCRYYSRSRLREVAFF